MKTLVMGGTRFVGKALIETLVKKGFDITVFTRGNLPIRNDVSHIQGDRNTESISQLKGEKFDVIIDTSGRNLAETQRVIECTGYPSHRFLYLSSAGIYKDVHKWPLDETSEIDHNSRHIGKYKTENWLKTQNIPFTSFRPTYIYGPGNYNPIEKWFFDRIINSRPIIVPSDGNTITQLGHVSDLADAMAISLEKGVAKNKIYNCSGKKGITFKGLIDSAATVCGKDSDSIEIVEFDFSGIDSKERKIFPLRLNHFLTDISLIQRELGWEPKFDLKDGLKDSYNKDYKLLSQSPPDFQSDISLIGH